MPSVTAVSENLEKEGPIIEIHFSISQELEKKYKEEGKPVPKPIATRALIDTGASACVVKKEIPQALGLEPIGVIKISTPSHKDIECYQYFMRMVIPVQGIAYQGPFIAAALEEQNINSLIGRDILANGILIYIGYMNQFTFSLL